MAKTDARLIGVSEVGHVAGGSTDTSWGKTQKDGVNVQLSLSRVDLMSGQSKLKQASHVTDVGVQLVFRMVESALQRLGYMLGLAAAKFAGDLTAGTPTAESLVIDGTLGSQELQLYAIGVGPASTRRVDAKRAVLSDPGALLMADNGYMLPSVGFDLLEPSSGDFLKITDAT